MLLFLNNTGIFFREINFSRKKERKEKWHQTTTNDGVITNPLMMKTVPFFKKSLEKNLIEFILQKKHKKTIVAISRKNKTKCCVAISRKNY